MKVFIGKYRNRCVSSIEQKYLNYKHGFNAHKHSNPFLEKLDDCIQVVFDNTINKFYYDRLEDVQRKHIKIDQHDTCAMDNTLSCIIVPMLEQLKEQKNGSQLVDITDVPVHLWPSWEEMQVKESYNPDSLVHQRWDWVMNEMIFAFKFARDEDMLDYYTTKDDPEYLELAERLDNGRRLFAKYYNGLWD